jgi:ribosome-associated protein
MLYVSPFFSVADSELEFTFARSSGPGGQNVNKVNSKAVLRWNVRQSAALPLDVRDRFLSRYGSRITTDGDLIVTSQRYRDQARNAADALEKLRALVAAVAKPAKKRRATKPSKASVARRIETKQATSRKKQLRRRVGEE